MIYYQLKVSESVDSECIMIIIIFTNIRVSNYKSYHSSFKSFSKFINWKKIDIVLNSKHNIKGNPVHKYTLLSAIYVKGIPHWSHPWSNMYGQ